MNEYKVSIDVNAHIDNIKYTISADNDSAKVSISFANVGYGVITAVKLLARGYNSFGDVVQIDGRPDFYVIIQDIHVGENGEAFNLQVPLPSSDIRKLDLTEYQICYEDGRVQTYGGKNIKDISLMQYSGCGSEKEFLDAIQDKYGTGVMYIPQELDCGWVCGCGRYNSLESTRCSKCKNQKSDIFLLCDPEFPEKLKEEYRQKQEVRRELDAVAQERKKKKQRKCLAFISAGVVLGLVLAGVIGNAAILAGRTTYKDQSEMKAALQGTYTYYDDSGDATKQLILSGETVTYKWLFTGTEVDVPVQEWKYSRGIIYTFENIVVTSEGNLKSDGDIYQKGGETTTDQNNESSTPRFEFSGLELTSNSSYEICTGSIKNTSSETYYYVKVKCSFKDVSDNVIDTDWTYAVGSEGLAPGESKSFRLSVPKNSAIISCTVNVIDYD